MSSQVSLKRIQIDKANTSMVLIMAAAAFISIASLMVSKTLLSQRNYQAKVVGKKTLALKQLKANNEAASQLDKAYKAFVSPTDNVIGGNATSTLGDKDGDNAKIVLDALPSKYDFPALTTSIEKLMLSRNYKINSITGTDDEVNQSKPGLPAAPVAMPFQVSVQVNPSSLQDVLDVLQKSIRPVQVNKLDITAADKDLTIVISATTYFQPETTVHITKEVVR